MSALLPALLALLAAPASAGCPDGMADIDSLFCIDKYEASTVDKESGEPLSPYYTPNPVKGYPGARWQYKRWAARPARTGEPMPKLPDAERGEFEPAAVSKPAAYPQGFMNRALAERACRNAGKRLCRRAEWYKACVGPGGPAPKDGRYPVHFPYGARYQKGKCNFQVLPAHPLTLLGRSSSELDDPRLMLAELQGMRLLWRTGEAPECSNAYGVFDMVGNQDEIVDDMSGENMTFVGSFYARDQKGSPQGCASAITAHHAEQYFDYSLGFRCCADPR